MTTVGRAAGLARIMSGLRVRRPSGSQTVLRVVGLACTLALLLVAPTGQELGGLAMAVLLGGAVLAAVWPEPAGGPAVIGATGVYVLLAPVDLTGGRAPVAAALVLAQLCCIVITTGAPPHAPVDPAMVRLYARRWAQMEMVAVLVWGMSLLATAMPGLGPVTALAGAVTALVGLAILGLTVLRSHEED